MATWLWVCVVHCVSIELQQLLRLSLFFSVTAHSKCILANLQKITKLRDSINCCEYNFESGSICKYFTSLETLIYRNIFWHNLYMIIQRMLGYKNLHFYSRKRSTVVLTLPNIIFNVLVCRVLCSVDFYQTVKENGNRFVWFKNNNQPVNNLQRNQTTVLFSEDRFT